MFLVCGEALFDVFIDPETPGGAREGLALRAVVGGSPFNIAIGLARLGRQAALCTEISNDRFGRRLAASLSDEGVALSFVRSSERATPLALVDVDAKGVPHYSFHGLREMILHPDEAVWATHAAGIRGIHVGSVGLVSPVSSAALLECVRRCHDKLVSLDPNVRLAAEPNVERWRQQVEAFRPASHLIKVSEEDLAAMYGADADAEAIAQSWAEARTELVVLTRGEHGCVVFGGQGERIAVPATETALVDTVGAGDTYLAALLCWLDEAGLAAPGLLRELTAERLREMAEFAGRAAAITCSRHGPDLPRRAELP